MGHLPSFFVPTAGHLAAQVSQPREGGGGLLGAVSLMHYLARYSQTGVNQVWNGIHFALVI